MLIFIGDKYEREDMSGRLGKLKLESEHLMVVNLVNHHIIVYMVLVLLYIFVTGFSSFNFMNFVRVRWIRRFLQLNLL